MTRVFCYWIIALTVFGCATASGGTQVLMYSDQSAGALLDSSGLKHTEEHTGDTVVFKTSASEFAAQIPAQAWTRIFVVAQYTSTEPGFLPALRDFAAVHPETVIHMQLWHSAGYTIREDIIVKASVAQTTWLGGITFITYVNAKDASDPPADPPGTRRFDGQVWPTFGSIEPRKPEAIMKLPAGAMPDRGTFDLLGYLGGRAGAAGDCADDCEARLRRDEQQAFETLTNDLAACARIYSDNMLKRYTCYATAVFHNTLTAAAFHYNNCVAECPENLAPGSQGEGIN